MRGPRLGSLPALDDLGTGAPPYVTSSAEIAWHVGFD